VQWGFSRHQSLKKAILAMKHQEELPSVPASFYDEEYYLTDCGGYEEFNATRGEELSLRLSRALDLGKVVQGERVLDLGCGRGEILLHCKRRGATVVGIDYSQAALGIAKELFSNGHGRSNPAMLIEGNVRRLCFADSSFDAVFMLDIVEHLYSWELKNALQEVKRVLKPGGRVIIHTAPNRTFVDYGFRYYTRFWHLLINRLLDKDHVLDLRPGLSPLIHVNEMTFSEMSGYLNLFTHSCVWLEVFLGDRRTLRTLVRGMLTHFFPLSALWPLNRLFAYWIWAVANK
jgi:ubiquinone/menaquinone biosynthesis C-methylase UbiE